jgi:hypothetical protein
MFFSASFAALWVSAVKAIYYLFFLITDPLLTEIDSIPLRPNKKGNVP